MGPCKATRPACQRSCWAKAVAVELALEQSESIADHVGIWGAMVCQWAREIGAEPRFLSPALAQAFLQTEKPTLSLDLPRTKALPGTIDRRE